MTVSQSRPPRQGKSLGTNPLAKIIPFALVPGDIPSEQKQIWDVVIPAHDRPVNLVVECSGPNIEDLPIRVRVLTTVG